MLLTSIEMILMKVQRVWGYVLVGGGGGRGGVIEGGLESYGNLQQMLALSSSSFLLV